MIKILHLYPDLMNLYGDWANADILARSLNACGQSAAVEKKSVGESIDLASYDLIYIGSGTERSQRACMRDLERHKDALAEMIEAEKHILATGNSHELFGCSVKTSEGEQYDTLGILDFETTQEHSRKTCDVIVTASFLQDKLIGFINRAGGRQKQCGQGRPFERPFTTAEPEAEKQSKNKPRSGEHGKNKNIVSTQEGIRYKNLLGTYMTGPVLVRNPPLLAYYAGVLCEEAPVTNAPADTELFKYQQMAYRSALEKLSNPSLRA